MSTNQSVPSRCVLDVVATIDGDGRMAPRSEAASAWIERFGPHVSDLLLDDDSRADLDAGDCVLMWAGEEAWELRRFEEQGAAWLVATDVTDREQRSASDHAARRCRALGRMAASVSHDLNNQFNLAMGLAAHLGLYVQSEDERRDLSELEQGTKVGGRMLSLLARMLSNVPARRTRIATPRLIDEALTLARKSLEHADVALTERVEESLPDVRVVETDVVQAVTEVLYLLAELRATSANFSASAASLALADGRERRCVVVRCDVSGVDAEQARAIAQAAGFEPGAVRAVAAGAGALDCVVTAALLHRRIGGELRCRADGEELVVEFCWPAAV